MEYTHKPVLLDACIQALNIRPDGIYVDGTLGRAGHSREIAGRLTTGRLICIDRDQAAIDAAGPGDADPQQLFGIEGGPVPVRCQRRRRDAL